MRIEIKRRLAMLEKQHKEKDELIIRILDFYLGDEPRPPFDCPGCEVKIAEARKTAVNGCIVIKCPDTCKEFASAKATN